MRKLLGLALFFAAGSALAVTVSMTSPTNGALYLAPATLPVKANASASGVGVNRVEFYANGTLIQTDTTSPYQFDWTNVAAGTYVINAIAYDNNGAQATSGSRTITVAATNTPPPVSLTAPADGSRYLNPTSVTISATASGPELNDIIARVDFYLNGSLANTITQAPFSYAATGLALGTYTLTAVATDSQGAQTTSAARTFSVSNVNVPPTVSLVIPIDNSRWNSPATVTIQANANSGEANDTVSVGFYANGTLLGTRSSSPFSLVNNFTAGTYTITAIATDGQSAQTTSAARTITVSDTNNPPTVSITAPGGGANFPTAPTPSISVTTSTTAGEVNGWLTKVEFYANGSLIGTKSSGPWNFTWTNVAQGSYNLTAIAYDNFNAATTSAAVAITVGSQPKLYFIHVDHLNTPRAIYDDQQQLRWKWEQQEPFGVNVPDENPSGLGAFEFPVRYLGQYFDRETNLAYNMSRDYDAAVGRYVQSDPIGLDGGVNTFVYAGLNPLTYVDSQGLFVGPVVAGVEALITIAGALIINQAAKNAEQASGSASKSGGGETTNTCPTCDKDFASYVKCSELFNYPYWSKNAALASIGGGRLHNQDVAGEGPCSINSGKVVGKHWNIRGIGGGKGSTRLGSLTMCPCCEDRPGGAVLREKYRVID